MITKDYNLRERLGTNAYLTIKNTWNAKVAADRFIRLSEMLSSNNIVEFSEGPCSKADIIKNNWVNGASANDV